MESCSSRDEAALLGHGGLALQGRGAQALDGTGQVAGDGLQQARSSSDSDRGSR
jgi:hypothetical protein